MVVDSNRELQAIGKKLYMVMLVALGILAIIKIRELGIPFSARSPFLE